MTVRKVDGGKRREELDCGCAFLWEPPAVENGDWLRRPVMRCGPHRKSGVANEAKRTPPEVTAK